MIRINLLPHRERLREKRKKEFVTLALLVALLGLVSAAAVSVAIAALEEGQRARNVFIENANRKLEAEIKEIGQLRQEIEALTARQNAVESLERDRTIPVHLFDELVRRVPNGMTLRTMKQDGSRLFLTGLALFQGPSILSATDGDLNVRIAVVALILAVVFQIGSLLRTRPSWTGADRRSEAAPK